MYVSGLMEYESRKEMLTECTIFKWIRTSEMYFSLNQYTVACDSVAYDVKSVEEI